ncbi:MAG: RHS repeat-associated core domain-containing protein, partial [Nitrospira sp.]
AMPTPKRIVLVRRSLSKALDTTEVRWLHPTRGTFDGLSEFMHGALHKNQSFTTPAANVPYKHRGKELDTSSNLYSYESRHYQAVFGRFISPDQVDRLRQDGEHCTYGSNRFKCGGGTGFQEGNPPQQ